MEFPKEWYWSSEANQRSVYDSLSKYYFLDFRDGKSDWEHAAEKTCCLIRIYEK